MPSIVQCDGLHSVLVCRRILVFPACTNNCLPAFPAQALRRRGVEKRRFLNLFFAAALVVYSAYLLVGEKHCVNFRCARSSSRPFQSSTLLFFQTPLHPDCRAAHAKVPSMAFARVCACGCECCSPGMCGLRRRRPTVFSVSLFWWEFRGQSFFAATPLRVRLSCLPS